MKHVAQYAFIVLGVSALLLTSGCKDGGSGVSGFFDGLFGGGDDGLSTFADAGSSVGGSGVSGLSGGLSGGLTDGITGGGSTGGGSGFGGGDSFVNPEPASVALFGGGIAGLALLRRRRRNARKSSAR